MKTFTLLDPSIVRFLLAGSIALGVVTVSRSASAACEMNEDCGFGFECVHETERTDGGTVGGTSGTSAGNGGTSSSSCDNDTCEWDETFETCPEDCKEVTSCQPAECDADDDCAEGYECEYAGSVAVTSSSGGEIIEHQYQCQLEPVVCLSDDDCAEGQVCYVPQSGTSGTTVGSPTAFTAVSSGGDDTTTDGSTSAGDSSSGGAGSNSDGTDGEGSDGRSDDANTSGGGDDGVGGDGSDEGYCAPEGSGGNGGTDAGTTDAGTGPTDSATSGGPSSTVGGNSDGSGETGSTGDTAGGDDDGTASGDTGTGSSGDGNNSGGSGGQTSSSDGDPGADGENDGKGKGKGGGCSVSSPNSPTGGDLGALSALGALMFGWFQRRRRAIA